VRAAKSERSGDAYGAQRVQTVCIGERLILRRRTPRISRAAGQPIVLFDARCHGANLFPWKAAGCKKIGGQSGSPLGVLRSA